MKPDYRPRGARQLWLLIVAVGLVSGRALCAAEAPTSAPATAPASRPADEPTSRPAPDTVLIRFGNKAVLTQGDWDRETLAMTPEEYAARKFTIGQVMVEVRRLQLYLDDHPELVPPELLDAQVERLLKSAKVENIDALNEMLVERGSSFADLREQIRLNIGRTEIVKRGIEEGKDDAKLEKMYKGNPEKFGDAKVQIRHIMLMAYPWDTPEQLAEKRSRLEKMKQQIEAGEKRFEDFIAESDLTQRIKAGDLGIQPQILAKVPDELPQAAFPLKPMELVIVRSPYGLHLVQAGPHQPAWRPLEEAKHYMRIWLEAKAFHDAMDEVEAKYPMVGVREPAPPVMTDELRALRERLENQKPPTLKFPTSRPAGKATATRPVSSRTSRATRPADRGTTRPATARPPATRPAARRPPATAPASSK